MIFKTLSDKLADVFKRLRSKGKLNENDVKIAMKEIKLAFLEADVNYKVVKKFVDRVSARAVGSNVLESLTPAQQVVKIVKDELSSLMGRDVSNGSISFSSNSLCVIMLCGLQGSGKTTHAAKLAKYFKSKGHRPLLVACDVYRPAAIEQLSVLGKQVGVNVFFKESCLDPIKIAVESIKHAKDYGDDIVILDTAGRLHIDDKLMNELVRIKSTVDVSEVLLTVDAMTGQDAVNVAEAFNEKLSIDGVILTKLDGDSRGGAALSVLDVTGKPIKFVGVGEKLDDLELFQPDRMASRILGMGDVLSLIERAEDKFDKRDLMKIGKKINNSDFNMIDLLEQFENIRKLGSMRSIFGMIPGVSNKVTDEDIDKAEEDIARTKAIISSMTLEEKYDPSIVNSKRKRRIAVGSGTKVQDVNQLLVRFNQMKKICKNIGKFSKHSGRKFFPWSR